MVYYISMSKVDILFLFEHMKVLRSTAQAVESRCVLITLSLSYSEQFLGCIFMKKLCLMINQLII